MGVDKREQILPSIRVPSVLHTHIETARNRECRNKQDTIMHLLARGIHSTAYAPHNFASAINIVEALEVLSGTTNRPVEVLFFEALRTGIWHMSYDPSIYLDSNTTT